MNENEELTEKKEENFPLVIGDHRYALKEKKKNASKAENDRND